MTEQKLDLHTHFYTEEFFQRVRDLPSEFSFAKSSTGQTIITYRGARFFGVTPAMTNVSQRLEDMDRVGIDVEVISLSTPNVFFTDGQHQPDVARMINDSYAELITQHPKRFKGFASIPMDAPEAALKELHRAIDELKLNGVILLSNIGGKPLTAPEYRTFFAEANRLKLCISASHVGQTPRRLRNMCWDQLWVFPLIRAWRWRACVMTGCFRSFRIFAGSLATSVVRCLT
jgi:predicted TIM-barrel fold metal-dependent hydrolase